MQVNFKNLGRELSARPAKSEKMNKKVLVKMNEKGLISDKELESGNVSQARYDMFVAGVKLIEGVALNPNDQLDAYKKKALDTSMESSELREVKSQLKKLAKMLSKKSYKKAGEIEGVEPIPTKAKTQKGAILEHLEQKGSITSFQAFADYGVTRLAAIIHVLRDKGGYNIKTSQITSKNRFGNVTNYAKYTLEEA